MEHLLLWSDKQKLGYMLTFGVLCLYGAYGILYNLYKTLRPDPPGPPSEPVGIRWFDQYVIWLETKKAAGKWWVKIVEEWSARLVFFVLAMSVVTVLMSGAWLWEVFVKLTPPFGVRAVVVLAICSVGYALYWVRENWQQGYATIEFAVAGVSAWKAVEHYPENGGMMSQVAWLQVMAAVYLVVRARDNWEKGKAKIVVRRPSPTSRPRELTYVDAFFGAVFLVGILLAAV